MNERKRNSLFFKSQTNKFYLKNKYSEKINKTLKQNYSTSIDYYNKICIDRLIYNNKSRINTKFNELLIETDIRENLKQYYKHE